MRESLCASVGAISIHSLRVEGDGLVESLVQAHAKISIHPLRVEGDLMTPDRRREWTYFNPLPPCGGRLSITHHHPHLHHFNPLPPCGGRPRDLSTGGASSPISIHSLRVEGDSSPLRSWGRNCYFNPLPPCGGRLLRLHHLPAAYHISIHSLRVEGDRASAPSSGRE